MERIRIAIVGLTFGRHIVRQLTEKAGAVWFGLGIPAYGSPACGRVSHGCTAGLKVIAAMSRASKSLRSETIT